MPIPKNQADLNKLRKNVQWYVDRVNRINNRETEVFTNFDAVLGGTKNIFKNDFEIPEDQLDNLDLITIEFFREKMVGIEDANVKAIFDLFCLIRTTKEELIKSIKSSTTMNRETVNLTNSSSSASSHIVSLAVTPIKKSPIPPSAASTDNVSSTSVNSTTLTHALLFSPPVREKNATSSSSILPTSIASLASAKGPKKGLLSHAKVKKQPRRKILIFKDLKLFSFPLNERHLTPDEQKMINALRDTFNLTLSERSVEEMTILRSVFPIKISANIDQDNVLQAWKVLLEIQLKISNKQDNPAIVLMVTINLILMFIQEVLQDRDGYKEILETTINIIEEENRNCNELWWYYAHLLMFKKHLLGIDNELFLKKIRTCIIRLKSKEHRNFLFTVYLSECLPACNVYPEEKHVIELRDFFPGGHWTYESFLVDLRHDFLFWHHIKNTHYFSIVGEKLLSNDKQEVELKSLTVNKEKSFFSTEIIIPQRFNRAEFFCFSLHLCPPGLPSMRINLPDLNLNENFSTNEKFNRLLLVKLQEKKLCNSDGAIAYVKIKENKKFFDIYADVVAQTIGEMNLIVPEVIKGGDEENNRRIHIYKYLKFDEWEARVLESLKTRKKLLRFDGIKALWLFHHSLTLHPFGLKEPLLSRIKELVLNCLEVTYLASKIKKRINQDDLVEFDNWFKLACNIVKTIKVRQKSIILSVGTPIEEGETSSTHAIYVAIKYGSNNQVQIIIANGGSYADEFHRLSSTHIQGELEKYHFAAFKPFILDTEHTEALEHYIFRLFCLEYMRAFKDDESKAAHVETVLKHIYLKKPNETDRGSFLGYKGKVFSVFERQDLPETFSSQLADNCTVHNLRKAIEIVLEMGILDCGLLEDNLLLGFDSMLSTFAPEKILDQGSADQRNAGISSSSSSALSSSRTTASITSLSSTPAKGGITLLTPVSLSGSSDCSTIAVDEETPVSLAVNTSTLVNTNQEQGISFFPPSTSYTEFANRQNYDRDDWRAPKSWFNRRW